MNSAAMFRCAAGVLGALIQACGGDSAPTADAGQSGAKTPSGKIWFEDLPVELAREAAVSGRVLHATFPGKAKDGGASCATVRPLERWRLLAPGA